MLPSTRWRATSRETQPDGPPTANVELVLEFRRRLEAEGLDADTIGWHLEHHRQVRRDVITLWVLTIGTFGPDLAFLTALGAPNPGNGALPRRAVSPYNALHHPAGLFALTATGLTIAGPVATLTPGNGRGPPRRSGKGV